MEAESYHLIVLVTQCSTCIIFWDPLAIHFWLGHEKDKIPIPLKSIRALQLTGSEESFGHKLIGQNDGTKHRRNEGEKKSL